MEELTQPCARYRTLLEQDFEFYQETTTKPKANLQNAPELVHHRICDYLFANEIRCGLGLTCKIFDQLAAKKTMSIAIKAGGVYYVCLAKIYRACTPAYHDIVTYYAHRIYYKQHNSACDASFKSREVKHKRVKKFELM